MTLYDKIMQDAQSRDQLYEFIPDETLHMYWLTMPVMRCIIDTCQKAPIRKINPEVYEVISLLHKLESRPRLESSYFSRKELKIFKDMVEGCEYCNRTEGCKFLRQDNGYKLGTFRMKGKSKTACKNLMKRINKILEEE